MNINKQKIAIIGFGRFGELLARILKPYGDIFVVTKRNVKIKGCRLIAYTDLTEMDWVIPAVPISSLEEVLKDIKPFLRRGSLLMDVCSVKVYPCRWLKKYAPKDVEILGCHPMFGPDSAKNGLKGLQIVVSPLRIKEKRLKEVLVIFKKIGLDIIKATPEEHDKQGSINLSLVHYIGRGLADSGFKDQKIKTAGFDKLMGINENVNNDTWQLFFDIQYFNPYSKKIRKNFLKSLQKIEKKINNK